MQRRLLWGLWILMGVLSEHCFGLTLTGQVVDTQARPIQGAEVVVCERFSVGCWRFQEANVIAPVVKTDAQGRFVIELDSALKENGTRQHDIFVVARKAGLACAWEWLNGAFNTWARRDFSLVLEPVGELGGQVVDARGVPVDGAEVQALSLTYSGFGGINNTWRVPGPKAWFSVTTDALGRFRFDQLGVDTNANACLHVFVPDSPNVYEFFRGSNKGFWVGDTDICLKLPKVGTITGQVRDDRGRPVPAVDLKLYSKQSPMKFVYKDRMTCSDAQGFFQFGAVPEGPHWIEVCGHGKDSDLWVGKRVAVSVKAGQTSKRAVVRVIKGGMFHFTVRDTRTRQPLEGIGIGLSNNVWSRTGMITDSQGRVRIRSIPGRFSISIGGDRTSFWMGMGAVRSGQTVPVEALVNSIPKVRGRVVDVQNRPVAHGQVIIGGGDHVVTDVDGRFSAYCSKVGSVKAVWIMARDRAHNRAVLRHVTDLSRSVTLKLKPAWTLIGQAIDPQGQAVSAARVCLTGRAGMDAHVLTDRQGRFTLTAIPPKQPGFDYRLTVNAAGYGPGKSRRMESQEQAGEILDMGNFPLVPATESVSGYVVNAQGMPVPGAEFFVNSLDDLVPQYPNSTATDEQGRFHLRHLCKGAIEITIWTYDETPVRRSETTVTLQVPAENIKIILGKDLRLE